MIDCNSVIKPYKMYVCRWSWEHSHVVTLSVWKKNPTANPIRLCTFPNSLATVCIRVPKKGAERLIHVHLFSYATVIWYAGISSYHLQMSICQTAIIGYKSGKIIFIKKKKKLRILQWRAQTQAHRPEEIKIKNKEQAKKKTS